MKDTLVEINFEPREKVDPTEINYDIRKLRDGLGDKLGVSVYLGDGQIDYIRFFPNEEQEKEFDCEKIFNSQK